VTRHTRNSAGGGTTRRRNLAMRFGLQMAAAGATLSVLLASTDVHAQVLLQADEIIFETNTRIVTARGHVEITEPGRILRANEVSYDPNADIIGASGDVSLTLADGNVAFADEMRLSGTLREGTLRGFAALIGENGRLAAVSGERWEGRYTEARGATFTSCMLCADDPDGSPVWQIKAARVVHDQVDQELIFEDATLELFGVPVAYLPIFSQPDPTVTHKSGFLLPSFGTSSYLGTFLRVPYYISMGASRDLTIEPYYTSRAGYVLLGEYRQRFADGGFWLQGSIGTDPDSAAVPGSSEAVAHLFGSGRWNFARDWRIGFDAELTSNDTYLYRYDISYIDRLTSDLFVDHVSGRNRFAATGYYFQSLRDSDVQGFIPLILPLIEYNYIPEDRIVGGRLRIDSSALYLTRDLGTEMARGSVVGDWMRTFTSRGGHVLTVDIMARGDIYHIDDAQSLNPSAPFNSKVISRGLTYAAMEWRWPFVGQLGFGETALVIEPIVQVVAASGGGNPTGLPNEDSTTFEFDETNLFIPNEFPGLDLWTGGPRSNVGVRATAFFEHGSVEAIVGQEYRARRDPNFAPGSGVGDTRSDIVARLKVQFPPYIDLVHRFRFDPVSQTLRRNELYLSANYGRSTLNMSYLKLSQETTDPSLGPREELNFTGSFNLLGNWAVFSETRYDLKAGRWLDAGLGILYEDECFFAQVGYRNRQTTDRDLRPSSSVILRIGLKTGITEASGR
jgi:LPS-assembly protein